METQAEILKVDPVLADMVCRLAEAYDPDRIYLFGSRARSDHGADSDYDLLIVVPDDAPPERKRSRLAYQCFRETGTIADIPVCTRTYFDNRLHLEASFPATIVREGVLLYDPIRAADT